MLLCVVVVKCVRKQTSICRAVEMGGDGDDEREDFAVDGDIRGRVNRTTETRVLPFDDSQPAPRSFVRPCLCSSVEAVRRASQAKASQPAKSLASGSIRDEEHQESKQWTGCKLATVVQSWPVISSCVDSQYCSFLKFLILRAGSWSFTGSA